MILQEYKSLMNLFQNQGRKYYIVIQSIEVIADIISLLGTTDFVLGSIDRLNS